MVGEIAVITQPVFRTESDEDEESDSKGGSNSERESNSNRKVKMIANMIKVMKWWSHQLILTFQMHHFSPCCILFIWTQIQKWIALFKNSSSFMVPKL